MTDHTQKANVAETMRDVMRDLNQHQLIDTLPEHDLTTPHLIDLPIGRNIHDLTEKHREAMEFLKPLRRKGTAHLTDLQSLIDWSNRFSGQNSALFADSNMSAPRLTCIADYHEAGPADVKVQWGEPTARHCHHRAVYAFPLSDEWKIWQGVAKEALEKDDLGEFIEANAKDILDPTPAIIAGKESDKNHDWENRLIMQAQQIEGRFGQLGELLQMSRQFAVHETSNLTVISNRDTGEGQIQFVNEHKAPDGSPLRIPNLLIIAIPVFQGGALYRMAVRFRYRKSGGAVRFIIKPYNPEKSFRAAFDEATEQARSETKLPIFFGTPEN
ncbi:hypothetical protein AN189_17950 [Loktanella sp. 3ANDIMAR09]|uniref:DUF2303 family protein n=1 Tax=Loktanella sp. 3ANDIMAR09 TaxID=1225657 RepID=UPI0006F9D57D|nr:DUF2303 family protein [Loktanella sp. 3ANDIMAR09]KQI66941.1 hypothetical protein AN189_17950 [Loktanella sp. 3ANDIMAR09]